MGRTAAVFLALAVAAAAEPVTVLLEWTEGLAGLEPARVQIPLSKTPPPGIRIPKHRDDSRYARLPLPGPKLWLVVRSLDFRIDLDLDGDLADESLRMFKDSGRDVKMVLPLAGEPAPRPVRFTLRHSFGDEQLGFELQMCRAGLVELGGRARRAVMLDTDADFRADRLFLDLDGDDVVEPVTGRFRLAERR